MPTPAPKHDTVFQGDDGGTPDDWAALSVDDSGNGNTLTNGTTKGSILAASAGDFTASPEFNVTIRFNHNTGLAQGYLFSRQSSSERHGLLVGNATTTSLQFVINGLVVSAGTFEMPGTFPASGGDTVLVSWSGRPNPLTTGASDALYHEVRVWNETDGHVGGVTFTSAAISGLGTADVVFGARHAGLATQDYGGAVIDVHYGTRFRTTTETYNDWIATAAAPTLTGHAPIEVPIPNDASGFGDAGELAGPQYALAAAATRRQSLCTASPLVNIIPMRSQGDMDDGAPFPARWRSANVPAPGALDWYWIGSYSFYCPVGFNYNRLKVHLQLQYSDPQENLTQIRVYSLNVPPDSLELALPKEEPAESLEYYYATVTIPHTISNEMDDGTGSTGGAWYSFAPIRIARSPGDESTTIAVAVLPADGGPDYRIRAVHVEPLRVDADDPGGIEGVEFG